MYDVINVGNVLMSKLTYIKYEMYIYVHWEAGCAVYRPVCRKLEYAIVEDRADVFESENKNHRRFC